MEINVSDNQLAFNRIITGNTAKNKICAKNCSKKVVNQYIYLRGLLYDAHLSKTKNVDTVIEFSDNVGFYLTILNKTNHVPNIALPAFFKNISRSDVCIKNLKEWINKWELACGKNREIS